MAVTFKEFSEDLPACNMCGYCVPVCPAYQEIGWESAAPRGKIFEMRGVEMRSWPLDYLLRRPTKLEKGTEVSREFTRAVYECTGCGACESVCHADIPFDALWDDVKEKLVNEGLGPLPEHLPLMENAKRTKNLYGKDNETRGSWFNAAGVEQSPSPEVVFWVGCHAAFGRRSIREGALARVPGVCAAAPKAWSPWRLRRPMAVKPHPKAYRKARAGEANQVLE